MVKLCRATSLLTVFGGRDSLQLKGSEITAELKYLLNLLTLCWHFSKKPFPLFLEETGYTEENVLIQEPKAGASLFLVSRVLRTNYVIDNIIYIGFLLGKDGRLK